MDKLATLLFSFIFSMSSFAAQVTAVIYATEDNKEIGKIVFTDTRYGLLIEPQLSSLSPGLHGFHLHEHPDCSKAGMSAGGHYDPNHTNTHQGPYGNGHLGDLPVLYIGTDGTDNTPVLAPRLTTQNLEGLAVMIHAGGDNYTDTPPLGGGGARMVCGVIK